MQGDMLKAHLAITEYSLTLAPPSTPTDDISNDSTLFYFPFRFKHHSRRPTFPFRTGIMWNSLGYEDYIIKKQKLNDGFVISVTDFVHIWSTALNNEDVINISKKLNPLIEANFDVSLVDKVLSLLDGVNGVKKSIKKNEESLLLHLESQFAGVKFKFELELKQNEAHKVFKEVTLPFILLAATLQMRGNKLVEIIQKKDAEINEYREENGMIRRSHLITREFSLDEFLKEEMNETSQLDGVMKNPSLILDVINREMLKMPTFNDVITDDNPSTKSDYITSGTDNSKTSSVSACGKKISKQTKIEYLKKKKKIGVSIHSGPKKVKQENQAVRLKL